MATKSAVTVAMIWLTLLQNLENLNPKKRRQKCKNGGRKNPNDWDVSRRPTALSFCISHKGIYYISADKQLRKIIKVLRGCEVQRKSSHWPCEGFTSKGEPQKDLWLLYGY